MSLKVVTARRGLEVPTNIAASVSAIPSAPRKRSGMSSVSGARRQIIVMDQIRGSGSQRCARPSWDVDMVAADTNLGRSKRMPQVVELAASLSIKIVFDRGETVPILPRLPLCFVRLSALVVGAVQSPVSA
jgi:hypothetical protein